MEFQGVSKAMPEDREMFQSGEGRFCAPSVAAYHYHAYASVMEAFVNPALQIFGSSDLAPSEENGNGVKSAKTRRQSSCCRGVLPPKCQNAEP